MRKVERLAATISPSPAALLLSTCGFSLESILLHQASDNLLAHWQGTSWVAFVTQAWVWVTLGWIAGFSIPRLGMSLSRRGRWVRWSVCGLLCPLVAMGLLAYLVSWGLYVRSGKFLNLEEIELVLANPTAIWHYVVAHEPAHLAVAAGVGAPGLLFMFGMLRWLMVSRWPVAERPELSGIRRSVWYACSMLMIGSFLFAMLTDTSFSRRELRQDALRRQLNPTVTLAFSCLETLTDGPIEPCLNPAELLPVTTAWSHPPATARDLPDIVFIAIESLRHDVVHLRHQGMEVTPHLNALASSGIQWTRAYAQSTHSDYSDVTIPSSLYPLRSRRHHYYQADDPWPKTLIYDVFKPAGYSTALFSSQNECWGYMDQFLKSPNLDVFFDAERSGLATLQDPLDPGPMVEMPARNLIGGTLPDRDTTTAALGWLTAHSQQPVFLQMYWGGPHFSYVLPSDCERPFQPCDFGSDVSFLGYPAEKVEIVRNAYFNALHEADRQLGRLVDTLRELGRLEKAIIVVYGDNGEVFHENGQGVPHAGHPSEPAVHVACVISAPQFLQPRKDDYPVELIDIAPTVLGRLGWPPHPNFQGRDLLAEDRPALEHRCLYLHTESGLSRADGVLRAGRWKFVHDRRTGLETLFDVQADPGETRNLIEQNPDEARRLREKLARWRSRQLAYYHYPQYYQQYYPPQAPSDE